MFERYTERARRVIFFSRVEASDLGSVTVETEHLLLGLLREDKNLTNRFRSSSSALNHVDHAERMRVEIKQRIGFGPNDGPSSDLPLSIECERVLAYAAQEAERLNHRHIGTEHLLLGIL